MWELFLITLNPNAQREELLLSQKSFPDTTSQLQLSQTRFADEGQLVEKQGGYTFFWKGKPKDE